MIYYSILSIITVAITASAGSYFTNKGLKTWYSGLKFPPGTPSGQLIGFAWSTIYLLIIISLFILWQEKGAMGNILLISSLLINAVLNILWTYIFFVSHNLYGSVIEILVLFISTIACIILIFPLNALSAVLYLPYALWTLYAGSFNLRIARIN